MTTATASPLTSGDVDLDPSGTVVRPRDPFSLEAVRRSVSRWGPVARHGGATGPVRVTAVADADHTPFAATLTEVTAGVEVVVDGIDARGHDAAVRQIARMFSLDHDARGLDAVLRRDPAAGTALRDRPGLRPVLFPSPYEAACWAVISPRLGEAGAAALQRRLVAAHGREIATAAGPVTAFPDPEALLRITELPGLPQEKLRRLHGVADAALRGDLDVHRLRALGPDEARAALRAIRGIGPFWGSGIWLRACGVVDEWPDEPRSGAILAGLHGRAADAGITDLVEPLAPYRMWVAFALRMSARSAADDTDPYGRLVARLGRTP